MTIKQVIIAGDLKYYHYEALIEHNEYQDNDNLGGFLPSDPEPFEFLSVKEIN